MPNQKGDQRTEETIEMVLVILSLLGFCAAGWFFGHGRFVAWSFSVLAPILEFEGRIWPMAGATGQTLIQSLPEANEIGLAIFIPVISQSLFYLVLPLAIAVGAWSCWLWYFSLEWRYHGALDKLGLLEIQARNFPVMRPVRNAVKAGRLDSTPRRTGPWATTSIAANYGQFAMRYGLIHGLEDLFEAAGEIMIRMDREIALTPKGNKNNPIGRRLHSEFNFASAYIHRLAFGAARHCLETARQFARDRGREDGATAADRLLELLESASPLFGEERLAKLFCWQLGAWPSQESRPWMPDLEVPARETGGYGLLPIEPDKLIDTLRADPLKRVELGLLAVFGGFSAGDSVARQAVNAFAGIPGYTPSESLAKSLQAQARAGLRRLQSSFREGKFGEVQLDVGFTGDLLAQPAVLAELTDMLGRHAYLTTLLMGLLKHARSYAAAGELSHQAFKWVRPAEYWRMPRQPDGDICCRSLYYGLLGVGPFDGSDINTYLEGAGPFRHYQIERQTRRRLTASPNPEYWRTLIATFIDRTQKEKLLDVDFEQIDKWEVS